MSNNPWWARHSNGASVANVSWEDIQCSIESALDCYDRDDRETIDYLLRVVLRLVTENLNSREEKE